MRRYGVLFLMALSVLSTSAPRTEAQEARRRWEILRQIRLDKFDQVLPQAMRDTGIDMWIVAMKEDNFEPLYEDLGRGYWMGTAYFVFTDRGGPRIERAVFAPFAYSFQATGAYDIINPQMDLATFVKERNPKRIGIDTSEEMGPADGLTHTLYQQLVKELGQPYASRLVSAEKLVSEFRSRRVAGEIVAFGEVCELARQIVEKALSNEVITPGKTTLEDVAWWIQDRLLERGASVEFDTPSVTLMRPDGTEETSTSAIITRGSLVYIDWGVHMMNFGNDMKRIAYVLKDGETQVPAGLQNAFDTAIRVRELVRANIKPGRRADATLEELHAKVKAAGYDIMELQNFGKPGPGTKTEVIIGCHSTGNTGHDVGPSIVNWQPLRSTFVLERNNFLVIEFFAWTPVPEWGGRKVVMPLEDDAVVTDHGAEWLAPPVRRILVIK